MTKWTKLLLVGALAALSMLVVGCQTPVTGSGSGGGVWVVNPHETDPAIPSDTTNVDRAYVPVAGPTPLNRLAVIFPGTTAQTSAFTEMVTSLRGIGYHVIVLRYSSGVGTQTACPDSAAATDPDCHRKFRSEVVFGENVADPAGHAYNSPGVSNPAALSVENRLIKLLDYLNLHDPTAGWGQFQMRSGTSCTQVDATYGGCSINWPKLSLIGHSQGAGVALYLGKFFPVSAVGMASGSYDAFALGSNTYQPAPWLSDGPFAVPVTHITTLLHTSDFGLGVFRSVENSIGVVGSEVNVTTTASPYGGSHRLVTNAPAEAGCALADSTPNHNSTAVDACAPDGLYVAAWRYMANGG